MVESYRCLCGIFPAEIGAAVLACLSIFLQVGNFVNDLLQDKFDLTVASTEDRGLLAIKAIVVILCVMVIIGTLCKNSLWYCPFLLLSPIMTVLLTVKAVLIAIGTTTNEGKEISMDIFVTLGVFFVLPIAVLIWMELVVLTARKYVNRFYP